MHCPLTFQQNLANRKVTRVQPPQVIVCYPPSFAPAQLVQSMSSFGLLTSHQPMPVAGQLLMTFAHPASAQWSYGAQLRGRVGATSGDPASDSGFDLSYLLRTIRQTYPPIFKVPAPLSMHALAAHTIQGVQSLLVQQEPPVQEHVHPAGAARTLEYHGPESGEHGALGQALWCPPLKLGLLRLPPHLSMTTGMVTFQWPRTAKIEDPRRLWAKITLKVAVPPPKPPTRIWTMKEKRMVNGTRGTNTPTPNARKDGCPVS